MTLRAGERPIDDLSAAIGTVRTDAIGKYVEQGGQRRYLSAMPRPEGHEPGLYSAPLRSAVAIISRSEWSARLKEQMAHKRLTSQMQNWASDDQGSHPTCWAAGTNAAFSTARVRQGHPFVRMSAMAIAVPISGGRSGGYEGDAVQYLTEHGGVDVALWGYTDMANRDSDPAVQANRLLHKSLESYECNGFDEFATAWLLGFPCTISYNWWSHVVMGCDLVEIEPGSFGVRIRNNWGESYGDKNDFGFGGYAVFREGKGTPSDGFAFRQVTASVK